MKTIVQVSLDEETNRYHVHAGEGSSVDECAFACSVIARVFAKMKFIPDTKTFEDIFHKYLTDPQFDEKGEDDTTADDTTADDTTADDDEEDEDHA